MSKQVASGGSEKERAIVIQMGARRSYAVPAALAAAGRLEALYTDLAGNSGIGRIARRLGTLPLPSGVKSQLTRLGDRMPPPEVAARTRTFDLPAARYEWAMRRAATPQERVEARLRFNKDWSRAMLAEGVGSATHVYAMMSGQTIEGEDFLVEAKKAGLTIVIDVTIALSTERIIAAEYAANPGWGAPPDTYLGAFGDDNPAYERMIRLADRLLCASQFVADDLVENWQAAASKVHVEPYSLHPRWLDLQNAPVEGRVLFPGSADLRKGIHHFARAAKILKDRGHDYVFIAAGNVDDAVRHNPAANLIEFAGRLPRPEMAKQYELADCVVLPTLAEGSAGVTYEAMASGIPVITTRQSGSLVEDGRTGVIIPESDPVAIADAVESVVQDRKKRTEMAVAAREKMGGLAWGSYSDRLIRSVFAHR